MPFHFYALQCSTNNTGSIDELMRSASTVNLPIVLINDLYEHGDQYLCVANALNLDVMESLHITEC